MKKLILSIISLFAFAFFLVRPAFALDTLGEKLAITLTGLPGYENTTDFKVYYTYFDTLGKTATVNLFIEKDGNGFRQTIERDKTAVSGYFQIQGSDIYDGQGKYNFYASAVTDSLTQNSDTISTTIDQNAPGNVTDYHKERVNATDYKLYWECPSDEDVEKTYIYRSKDTSFTADSGTRVQEVPCNKEESKTTIVVGDANVDYYFALRAIDRAGNASGVVTDAPGTVIAGTVAGVSTQIGATGTTGTVGKEGKVQILPKEEGEELSPTPEEGQLGGGISSEAGAVQGAETGAVSRLPYFVIGGGILLVLVVAYYFLKNRNK